MNDLTKMIIGAVVAYLVPKLLEPLVRGGEGAAGLAWLPWLLGHAAAGAAGGLMAGGLAAQGLGAIGGGVANWAAFGLFLGLAQWLVLQRGGRLSPLWVVGSLLGWSSCAWAQAMAVPAPLIWIFAGLLAGLLQWPILARHRRHAFWWIPAGAAGAFLGGSVGFGAAVAMLQSGMTFASAWILGWAIVALGMSLVTGFAIGRMPTKTPAPA